MSEQEIKTYAEAAKYNMESRNRTGRSELGQLYNMVISNYPDQLGSYIEQIHTSEMLEYNGMNYASVRGMKEVATHVLESQIQTQEMNQGMAR